MGWTSYSEWNSKKQVVNHLKNDLSKNYNVLADKSTSTGLWAAIEHKETSKRYIFLALIESRSARGYKEYYVKDMDESMGPCYYDCPLEFFDIVPCPTEREWAAEWREKVKAYHANKKIVKEKVKTNSHILSKGIPFKLYGEDFTAQFQNEKGEWVVLKQSNQQLYRLKKKQLGYIELKEGK